MKQSKKHLDFEVNLIPCIDLLSVCICFLLITAVWLNVGSMDVKQAIGGQSQSETAKNPLIWVRLTEKGDCNLEVQQSAAVPANLRKLKVVGVDSKIDLDAVEKAIASIKQIEPSLNTGLILPVAATAYADIIDIMDKMKKLGLKDLGVSPL